MENIESRESGRDDPFGWIKFQDDLKSGGQGEFLKKVDLRGENISKTLSEMFEWWAYDDLLKNCDMKETAELVGYTMTYAQIFMEDSNSDMEREDMKRNLMFLLEKIVALDDPYEKKRVFCEDVVEQMYEGLSWENYDSGMDVDKYIFEQIVDRLIVHGYAYHGFNSGIEESIRRNGLSTSIRLTSVDEIKKLDEMVSKYNVDGSLTFGYLSGTTDKWGDNSSSAVFYATDPNSAYEYASVGPEWLEYFIDGNRSADEKSISNYGEGPYILRDYEASRGVIERWCDRMMGLKIDENVPPRAVWMNGDEREGVLDFFEQQWQIYGNGGPMVALIPRKVLYRDNVPESFSYENLSKRNNNLVEKVERLMDFATAVFDGKERKDIPPEALHFVNLPIYHKAKLFEKKAEYRKILDEDLSFRRYSPQYAELEKVNLAENDEIFRSLLNPSERRFYSSDREERARIERDFEDGYFRAMNFTAVSDALNGGVKPVEFKDFLTKYYEYRDLLGEVQDCIDNTELQSALATALIYSDYPEKKLKQLLVVLSRKDIPVVAKEYLTFETINPIEGISDDVRDSDSVYFNAKSPVLCSAIYNADGTIKENVYSPNAEHRRIIFTDLVKCAFGSNGVELERFIKGLADNERLLYDVAQSDGDLSGFNMDQIEDAARLISQCDALYRQTVIGESAKRDLSDNICEAARQTIKRFQPTKRYGLADRVVRCFCYPLGIKGVNDALTLIEETRKRANVINGSASMWGQFVDGKRVFELEKGDLVKSIKGGPKTLAGILQNGILAYNYVGDGRGLIHRDFSQLDTDFSMVGEQQGNFYEKVKQTSAGQFMAQKESEVVIAVHPHENLYQVTESIKREEKLDDKWGGVISYPFENYSEVKVDYGKYELFHIGAMPKQDDDYGIRTGLPSSEISCIMVGRDVADEVVELIKQNTFYVPVVDKDGVLLLTYEEYSESRGN